MYRPKKYDGLGARHAWIPIRGDRYRIKGMKLRLAKGREVL